MTDTELITAATAAAAFAHCPYSRFRVGAAVLANGKMFCGCNVENASLGLTICRRASGYLRRRGGRM